MAEKVNKLNTEPPASRLLAPAGEPNRAPAPKDAQAQATPKDQQRPGAMGVQLPEQGEIAGGAITKEVFADETPGADPYHAMNLQRMARGSALATKLGGDGRPTDEWGLVGKCDDDDCPGDTWRGHGILIDVKSLDKIRVHDGAVLREGVYANSRNFSQGLVTGDLKDNLKG